MACQILNVSSLVVSALLLFCFAGADPFISALGITNKVPSTCEARDSGFNLNDELTEAFSVLQTGINFQFRERKPQVPMQAQGVAQNTTSLLSVRTTRSWQQRHTSRSRLLLPSSSVLITIAVTLVLALIAASFSALRTPSSSKHKEHFASDLSSSVPTDTAVGLSASEAEKRLLQCGPNELEATEQESFLSILFMQLKNMIFVLTGLAALLCYMTDDNVKGNFLIGLVLVVCLFNAIGEYSGQDASAALRAMMPQTSRVLRDGQLIEVAVEEIVPGDIVHVSMGDLCAADMRILQCVDLQTNETVLTGEPNEVNKTVEVKDGDSTFPSNMLYKSTGVVAGTGVAEVTATGMQTEVGLIAKRLNTDATDTTTAEDRLNPLQRSINALGTIISIACFTVIVFASVTSFLTGYQSMPPSCAADDTVCLLYDSGIRGLLMAVVIIPHGLPLVFMVMLRVASKCMATHKALVMRRSAVDYLGATQVICTDKTGTLTEGKMAAKVLVGMHRATSRSASGASKTDLAFYPLRGLDPYGRVFESSDLTTPRRAALDGGMAMESVDGLKNLTDASCELPSALVARASLAAAFLGCHSTTISKGDDGAWQSKGSMSEAALKVAACKGNLSDGGVLGEALLLTNPRQAEVEVPFTSKRKMSATVHSLTGQGEFASLRFGPQYTHFAILKGAPDRILEHMEGILALTGGGLTVSEGKIAADELSAIRDENQSLAKQALRSLLMAVRPLTAGDVQKLRSAADVDARLRLILEPRTFKQPLTFLGLWGIFDPPRPTVPLSVATCHAAGVRVVMITGDQWPTAVAIGKQVGILPKDGLHDETSARRCSDLHEASSHNVPAPTKEISKKSSRKSQGELTRQLSVHDIRTGKDSHEKEYKDTNTMNAMTSEVVVWSRAQPTDKVAIVESLMHQDRVTAMTGDGVNDAPALKRASIGVAMGISGTAVARQAADMVLLDDNFSTIVAAIKEGRRIYGNIQKYVVFNLSMKGSECFCLLVAILGGFPLPIQGLQQLVNLVVTHIIPPMALAWEDAEDYVMKLPPRETHRDLVINRVHMCFRWLPFIFCYSAIIMPGLCLFVWMNTGFVHVDALIGSTVLGDLQSGKVACETAGVLDEGVFYGDDAPFHCRCYVRQQPWAEPRVVEEWGRLDATSFTFDPWASGPTKTFDLDNTPFAGDGHSALLEPCTDASGTTHQCWKASIATRPLLDSSTNCAAYGTKIGETMTYASIQLSEVLSLSTFRTDGFFMFARFSQVYTCALFFNVVCLAIVFYVPAIAGLLGFVPLTYLYQWAFVFASPVLIIILSELTKMIYRSQLEKRHTELRAQMRNQQLGECESVTC